MSYIIFGGMGTGHDKKYYDLLFKGSHIIITYTTGRKISYNFQETGDAFTKYFLIFHEFLCVQKIKSILSPCAVLTSL